MHYLITPFLVLYVFPFSTASLIKNIKLRIIGCSVVCLPLPLIFISAPFWADPEDDLGPGMALIPIAAVVVFAAVATGSLTRVLMGKYAGKPLWVRALLGLLGFLSPILVVAFLRLLSDGVDVLR